LLERSKGLKAVEPRHVDVEDDDVRVDPPRGLERLAAISCDTHHIEVVSQHRGHPVKNVTVVIHENNSRPHSGTGPREARRSTVYSHRDLLAFIVVVAAGGAPAAVAASRAAVSGAIGEVISWLTARQVPRAQTGGQGISR
jgi:hypothetical protein